MSLVAETLAAAGLERGVNIDQRLEKIQRRVAEASDQFCRLMKEQYVDCLPGVIVDAQECTENVDKISKDIDKEYNSIVLQLAHAQNSAPKIDKTSAQERLHSTMAGLAFVKGLVEIADGMKEVHLMSGSPQKNSARTAKLLTQVEDKLKEVVEGGSAELDSNLAVALREEVVSARERLIFDLFAWWSQVVEWNTKENYANFSVCLPSESAEVQENITALHLSGCLLRKVHLLVESMVQNFVVPILKFGSCSKDEACVLIVNCTEQKIAVELNTDTKGAGDCKNPAKSLKLLFKLLDDFGQRLLAYSVVVDGESKTLAQLFGEIFGPKLAVLLLEMVLKPAVPCVSEEFDKFKKLIEQMDTLEGQLRIVSLIPDTMEPITKFAENTDTLFMKRRCQKILQDGRELITLDLHNTVEVGETVDSEATVDMDKLDEMIGQAGSTSKQIRLENLKKLPPLFVFPKCKISAGTEKFVALVEKTVEEACDCQSAELATCLFETSRDLVELYLCLTPVHHKESIQSVPTIAGIFYNDCYYITHRLLTLGWEVTPALAKVLAITPNSPRLTYVDFVPGLRQLAADFMRAHVNNTKNSITTILGGTNGFVEISEPKNLVAYEKALKACVLNLEQIQRVWKEVLTPTVLMKALGNICGHVLRAVCDSVLVLEDMTSDDSAHITDIITRLLPQLEILFTEGDEQTQMHRFCETAYFRCKEVLHCVRGTLLEIDDRWADGKGPLAQWLTALEVRQLVRALFQTSDRRAAVLANIK